jgi:hypothetical protein
MWNLKMIPATCNLNNVDQICNLVFDEKAVTRALTDRYDVVWAGLAVCPRTCPSERATLCSYLRYFSFTCSGKSIYHPHMYAVSIPAGMHTRLMRFRLGGWKLNVVAGRHVAKEHRPGRDARVCTLCSLLEIEDEYHVVFECAHYDDIRRKHRHLFDAANMNMQKFFNNNCQYRIARFLTDIYTKRFPTDDDMM